MKQSARHYLKSLARIVAILPFLSLSAGVGAEPFASQIPMRDKGGATYYVNGFIDGLGDLEMMVDTGSGYFTINREALDRLDGRPDVRYLKDLRGILANGQELIVPVYRIGALRIGGDCWVHDVEAAVFPGTSRQILGLSALRRASPFVFSVDPPELTLSSCAPAPLLGAETVAETHQVD